MKNTLLKALPLMLSIANIVMFLKRFNDLNLAWELIVIMFVDENFIGVMGCGIEDKIQPLKL